MRLFCLKCSGKMYKMSRGKIFACGLGHQYAPLANTMFRKSSTPIDKWKMAFGMLNKDKNTSAKQIERTLRVTYKTAWRIKHLIIRNPAEAEAWLANEGGWLDDIL